MKKIFYLQIIIISCILYSCKKDHSTKPDNGLHAITFNVTGFTTGTRVFASNNAVKRSITDAVNLASTSSLSTSIVNLVYQVYDASGTIVHTIHQTPDSTNFGTIKDNLAVGTYTIVFVGGQNYLYGYQSTDIPVSTPTVLSGAAIYYQEFLLYVLPFSETFFKKITLTVTSATAPSQNIALDRINAELEVNIEDAIPANATKVSYSITGESTSYSISKSTSNKVDPDFVTGASANIPADSIGVKNFKFSGLVLNTNTPFSVDIKCYSNSTVIAEKVVNNVTCQANKITILTGSLFGGSGSSGTGFAATIDTTWNPVQTTIPFSNSLKLAKPVSN